MFDIAYSFIRTQLLFLDVAFASDSALLCLTLGLFGCSPKTCPTPGRAA